MRRLAVATALGAVAGAALLATGPAQAGADDNRTVCAAAKKTIESGAPGILTDLRQAASQAAHGDNAAADATVRAVSPKFSAIGTSLQQVAGTASDQNLKSALTGLGTEFSKVGRSLTDLDSLRKVDESQIDAQGQRLASICGFAPGPGASGSPSRTAPSTSVTS